MRVLQINTEKTWRGGERQTLYTLLGLVEAGVNAELLCLKGYPMENAAKKAGIKTHSVARQSEAISFLALKTKAFDLFHPQTGKGHSQAVFTKSLHKKPIVYTRRVNFEQNSFLTGYKYKQTDKTVAISRAIRDTLKKTGVDNIEIISSAVKKKEVDKKRAQKYFEKYKSKGKRIIATTGDMVPQKDPVTMVETIRALKDKRKDFIFFHFGNHQMGSDIFPLIVKHDLEPYYKTPGHIDGVEDLFPEFDVFFISSNETEGLCSSIYDAFVYRVPVVSTLTGGMYDSVADRGLTCGPRKPECLAKHLDYLLDNPEKGKQMAEKAYIWAENNVTIDSITSKYLKLYDELIASKR